MKTIILFITLFISSLSIAGGWTKYDSSHGDIINIELIRAQGFMIHGNIGDAAACGSHNYLWIPIDHPQYDKLYSTALAAYMAGKKIQAYAHECKEIGWHGGSFSTMNGAGAMYIKN